MQSAVRLIPQSKAKKGLPLPYKKRLFFSYNSFPGDNMKNRHRFYQKRKEQKPQEKSYDKARQNWDDILPNDIRWVDVFGLEVRVEK